MNLNSSKKETPCFHRPFSIQIDSPLPQGVTQPVSWESDFSIHNKAFQISYSVLQNKSPPKLHILSVLSLTLDRSKMETPCFHRLVHCPRVSLSQFQEDLMLHYIIKALQILVCDQFCLWIWIALKRKFPDFTDQFQFRLTVHCHKGVTLPISRGSDFVLHNNTFQISYFTCSASDFGQL